MRSKSFLILVALTLVAVLAAGASIYLQQAANRLPEAPDRLFPGLVDRVNDVAAVAVATSAGDFRIERTADGDWGMVEKNGYPVKFETIKQAVVGMASLRPIEPRTGNPALFDRIDLVDPADAPPDARGQGVRIVLEDAAGTRIAGVIVGKTSSVPTTAREGWYYVREPDAERSWLASGRIEVFEQPTAWLDSELMKIDRKRIRSASSIPPDGEVLTVSRPDNTVIDFMVEDVPAGMRQTFDTAGNKLGAAMGFLNFEDVKPLGEVDFAGAHEAEFRTFDGLIVRVGLVPAEADGFWTRFEARFDPAAVATDGLTDEQKSHLKDPEAAAQEATAINERYAGWAFRLPKYKGEDFMTAKASLIIKDDTARQPATDEAPQAAPAAATGGVPTAPTFDTPAPLQQTPPPAAAQ